MATGLSPAHDAPLAVPTSLVCLVPALIAFTEGYQAHGGRGRGRSGRRAWFSPVTIGRRWGASWHCHHSPACHPERPAAAL